MKSKVYLILPSLATCAFAFSSVPRPPFLQTAGRRRSSTISYATTDEQSASFVSFDDVLDRKCSDDRLRTVLFDLLDACADTTEALRTVLFAGEGESGAGGVTAGQQLSVDVVADNIFWEACAHSDGVAQGASMLRPTVRDVDESGDGQYLVGWDALDGSSVVNNWAAGSIVGVWPKGDLVGATGRSMSTALVALFGPRTTVLVALDDGVYEFTYGCTPEGCQLTDGSWHPWICSRERICIDEKGDVFSPGNLRAAKDLPGYRELIDSFIDSQYTLRFSGALVPDIYQQFTNGQGVFLNPHSDASPSQLCLAFQAAPIGYLVEMAGGKSSDGITGGSILDLRIDSAEQQSPLCVGSANEVDRFNEIMISKGS